MIIVKIRDHCFKDSQPLPASTPHFTICVLRLDLGFQKLGNCFTAQTRDCSNQEEGRCSLSTDRAKAFRGYENLVTKKIISILPSLKCKRNPFTEETESAVWQEATDVMRNVALLSENHLWNGGEMCTRHLSQGLFAYLNYIRISQWIWQW